MRQTRYRSGTVGLSAAGSMILGLLQLMGWVGRSLLIAAKKKGEKK